MRDLGYWVVYGRNNFLRNRAGRQNARAISALGFLLLQRDSFIYGDGNLLLLGRGDAVEEGKRKSSGTD
jgi:hypothetical protein